MNEIVEKGRTTDEDDVVFCHNFEGNLETLQLHCNQMRLKQWENKQMNKPNNKK